MENGPFEDVLPIENGDIPASYVSLPEGNKNQSNFLANSFFEAMAKMRSSQDPNYLVSIGYPLPSSMGIASHYEYSYEPTRISW